MGCDFVFVTVKCLQASGVAQWQSSLLSGKVLAAGRACLPASDQQPTETDNHPQPTSGPRLAPCGSRNSHFSANGATYPKDSATSSASHERRV